MPTRREFFKQGAVASVAGILPVSLAATEGLEEPGGQATEWLYAGKPMSYWITRANSRVYDPELESTGFEWPVTYFGQAAVPHLIERLGAKSCCEAAIQLETLADPETICMVGQALEHQAPQIRAMAIEVLCSFALGRPGWPQVTQALRKLLPPIYDAMQDEAPAVRNLAEWFMCRYGPVLGPSFFIPLRGLDDNNPAYRVVAVRWLAKLEQEQAIPVLVEKLSDPVPKVRWVTAEVLSELEPDHPGIVPVFADYLIHRTNLSPISFSNLDGITAKAMPLLEGPLYNGPPAVRRSIVHGLSASKAEAVLPTLMKMVDDESAEVRGEAVLGLRQFGHRSKIVPCLVRAVADRNRQVQDAATSVFLRSPLLRRKALPGLIRLLESGRPCVRVFAALIIGDLGQEGEEALPALERSTHHPDASVQLASEIAIAEIRPSRERMAIILVKGLDHDSPELCCKAMDVIEGLGEEWRCILVGLLRCKLPQLMADLEQPLTRARAEYMLGLLGPDAAPAIPHLVALLRTVSRDDWLRHCLPRTLASIGPQAIGPLLDLLEDNDVWIRARAIRTLGLMGGQARSVVPRLIDKLEHGCVEERIGATQALGNIGHDAASAVPALRMALKDRDLAILRESIDALGKIKDQAASAIPDLARILDQPSLSPVIKRQAVAALAEIGPGSGSVLIRALRNNDAAVRASAAKQLPGLEGRVQGVVPALTQCLSDQDAGVQASAAWSLGMTALGLKSGEIQLVTVIGHGG